MTALAKEYGNGLYELAQEESCADEVLESLELAAGAFQDNPGYARLVQDPAIGKAQRLEMLDQAFAGVHPYVRNLLKLLCQRSALGLCPGCLEQFRARYYADRGILPVEAVSAVALTDEQQRALTEKLSAQLGKTILLRNTIDPAVLGGVKLRYEGLEVDGTAAGRLEALRRRLTR